MTTFEERARQHALAAVYGDKNDSLYKDIETECIKLATEQDRISRAEERERCIKAVCREHCDWCKYNGVWHDKYDSDCQRCVETDELRKAIERTTR